MKGEAEIPETKIESAHETPEERIEAAFSDLNQTLQFETVALHQMHFNFCRIHQTLRVTTAMEAGVTDHVWDLEEIIGLLDDPTRR
jgi:hypothetical protein